MDKKKFVEAMEALREGWDAWTGAAKALGLHSTEDKIMTLIDSAAVIISEAVGDIGLPITLDYDNVMYMCGNDLPLVMWYAWECDFGRNPKTVRVGRDYEKKVVMAEDLFDVIEKVKELHKVV